MGEESRPRVLDPEEGGICGPSNKNRGTATEYDWASGFTKKKQAGSLAGWGGESAQRKEGPKFQKRSVKTSGNLKENRSSGEVRMGQLVKKKTEVGGVGETYCSGKGGGARRGKHIAMTTRKENPSPT